MNWVVTRTGVISWYILRTHVTIRDIVTSDDMWRGVTCRDSPRPCQEVAWTSYRTWYHLSDMNVEAYFINFICYRRLYSKDELKQAFLNRCWCSGWFQRSALVKTKPKPRLRWWPGLLWALVTWDWPMMGDKSTETTQCHHQGGPCQPGKLVCTFRESIKQIPRELYLNLKWIDT